MKLNELSRSSFVCDKGKTLFDCFSLKMEVYMPKKRVSITKAILQPSVLQINIRKQSKTVRCAVKTIFCHFIRHARFHCNQNVSGLSQLQHNWERWKKKQNRCPYTIWRRAALDQESTWWWHVTKCQSYCVLHHQSALWDKWLQKAPPDASSGSQIYLWLTDWANLEHPTKTHQGGLTKMPQNMFATGDERCLVKLLEKRIFLQPPSLKHSDPLYLRPLDKPKRDVWFQCSQWESTKSVKELATLIESTGLHKEAFY